MVVEFYVHSLKVKVNVRLPRARIWFNLYDGKISKTKSGPHTRIASEDDLKKDKAGRKWTTKPNLNKYVPQRLLIVQQQINI